MISFDLNWLAVALAVVANMVVGAIWYGPLFGTQWMDELGFTRDHIEANNTAAPYVVAVVNSLLMAFVLANVMRWAGADSLAEGVGVGVLMWFGFTGFTFAANHAFEERSTRLWYINSGTYLVGLIVMGAVFGAMS